MHWLANVASRAGLKGASTLQIPAGAPTADAWELAARGLGVSPTDLAARIAEAMHIRVASLAGRDAKTQRLVPERFARRYNVLAIRETDRSLVVATADPNNIESEQAIEFASGRRVQFELAPPQVLSRAIDAAYAPDKGTDGLPADLDDELTDAVAVVTGSSEPPLASHDVEAAPIVRLTNLILRDAVRQRASDIHIEPSETTGSVRLRIDGVMRHYMQLPLSALNRVVSRIKVLSRLDIADRMRPQDGRARIQTDGSTFDLRVSTVPIRDAEKAVIRILRPDSGRLPEIGMLSDDTERLRQLLSQRDGIVFVTGPTGSGKTTTMYGVLRELANGEVNIMTVEDPVEYELAGLSQMQVDPRRGVTFASALRAILRQDPDVIFVGEIRDLETAEIAVQAAMTGHLVLATLHTNDAVSAVARLADLGLERSTIAATVRGSLAQRLVRQICSDCSTRIDGELTGEESRLAGLFGERPTVRAVGCAKCGNTGFVGRLPVQEIAVFTPEITEAIVRSEPSSVLQRLAVAGGMRTLRLAVLQRVHRGETTLTEVERIIGDPGSPDSVATAAVPKSPMVLVVDDDPVERLLLSSILEKAGFRTTQCEDGLAATERLRSGAECALVVTDFHMPRMNGDEVIRAIRRDAGRASVPIIVLTGSSDVEREAELIDAGADDYLRKPVDPVRLLARVRGALRRVSSA